MAGKPIPYLRGINRASLEELKSFCASLATYGGLGMFHIEGITPEAGLVKLPDLHLVVDQQAMQTAWASLEDEDDGEVDFVSLGCPHLSLPELAHLADLLAGKKVTKTFWITTARPTKQMADRMGYTRIIEESGAIIAADTCCVVAPIRERFRVMATDSAKACYYAYAKNKLKTAFLPFDEVVKLALL